MLLGARRHEERVVGSTSHVTQRAVARVVVLVLLELTSFGSENIENKNTLVCAISYEELLWLSG